MLFQSYIGFVCERWNHTTEPSNAHIFFVTLFYNFSPRALCNICEWLGVMAAMPNPFLGIFGICKWCLRGKKTYGNLERLQAVFPQLLWWPLLDCLIECHPNWMTILCLHNDKSRACTKGGIWRHQDLLTTYIVLPSWIGKTSLIRLWGIHHLVWAWIVYLLCTIQGTSLWLYVWTHWEVSCLDSWSPSPGDKTWLGLWAEMMLYAIL
jgi:hypothetical protein